MRLNIPQRAVVNGLGREARRLHRHADRHLYPAVVQMRSDDGAREAGAFQRGREGDHFGLADDTQALQRQEFGVARADADAADPAAHEAARHGLRAAHCVTAMAGRKALKRPTGAAVSTEMR